MKKEDLIKLGLTEEQADKVLEANSEQLKGFIPKHRFDEVNNTKKELENQISDRDKQLEELKKSNKDNEELQNTIKQLQEDNKTAQEEYHTNLSKIKLDNAVDNALNGAKAKNIKAVKALLDMDKVKFENESLIGIDEQIKYLRESEDSKFLFEIQGPNKSNFSGVTPGYATGGATSQPDTQKTYSQMMAELGD